MTTVTPTLIGTAILIYAAVHIALSPGKIMEILRVLAFVALGYIAADADGAIGTIVAWAIDASVVTYNWINGLLS